MKNKRTIPKPDAWQFSKLFSVDVKHLCPECLKVGDYESHWDRDVYNKKGLLLGTRTGTICFDCAACECGKCGQKVVEFECRDNDAICYDCLEDLEEQE